MQGLFTRILTAARLIKPLICNLISYICSDWYALSVFISLPNWRLLSGNYSAIDQHWG